MRALRPPHPPHRAIRASNLMRWPSSSAPPRPRLSLLLGLLRHRSGFDTSRFSGQAQDGLTGCRIKPETQGFQGVEQWRYGIDMAGALGVDQNP